MAEFYTFEKPWEQVEKEFQEYERMKGELHEEYEPEADNPLLDALAKWQRETSYMEFRRCIEKRVMGQKNLGLFLLVVYRYIATVVSGEAFPSGVLLAAPSGCGKTETFRALRDYFRKCIPAFGNVITQTDASLLTPNGYQGADISAITEAMEEQKTGGVGIVFLDEFDKVLAPLGANGEDLHSNVVHELLTLIEGKAEKGVDTSNTLFVCAGAFDLCRKKRKDEAKGIGFITETESADVFHYRPITKEDILAMGAASHELMGRISMLINYEPLDAAAVEQIIDMTCRKVGLICGMEVMVGDTLRCKLHESSNSEYGCRLFYNILLEETIKVMTDMYERTGEFKYSKLILKDVGSYEFYTPRRARTRRS